MANYSKKQKKKMDYKENLLEHYKKNWSSNFNLLKWKKVPIVYTANELNIIEFPPTRKRNMWTYATCGMSKVNYENPIEIHIFSKKKSEELCEILTAIVYYHQASGNVLNLWHTVNFGKPWMENSECNFGLISLPYLDGPNIEDFLFNNKIIKCYWLIPITEAELKYKKEKGVESLELLFENKNFDYSDSSRRSTI